MFRIRADVVHNQVQKLAITPEIWIDDPVHVFEDERILCKVVEAQVASDDGVEFRDRERS